MTNQRTERTAEDSRACKKCPKAACKLLVASIPAVYRQYLEDHGWLYVR